ncbi:MAG TPA: pyrroloquinoline quinone biosynthesis protein PqqE [Polyangiaceae bacterium]|nr:pyrroloquinoline quinone biosynthesis protein PqqE [Polyangiaceae bacterium]
MTSEDRLYTLIAELTYLCPLRCVYCSNPTNLAAHPDRLSTSDWLRVFGQAAELGALQLNLSGGEPLLRRDLEELVAGAHALDFYSNLITSGLPLTRERLLRLKQAGLSSVQVSIQDSRASDSDRIAGRSSFEQKLEVARWVKELELPLTLNVVLHRQNLGRIAEIIALAERLNVDRLELANTQYLAWALENRSALLPSQAELNAAREVAKAAKERLKGKIEVLFVLPDYYSDRPKACMSGWGKRYLLVSPDGLALPCHLAHTLPGLHFDNVQERSLADIWHHSAAFAAFRGEAWMPEPCKSCDRRDVDFGGCRCQAFHLTGDATATDPACGLSPKHALITEARAVAQQPPLIPLALRYREIRR